MGLLKNITDGVYNTPSVNNLTISISHLELIKKHSVNYFCRLELNGKYFITDSILFDAKSILLSYSTNDFWNGLLPKHETLYSFSIDDDSILSLFQLFSFEMRDKIKNIICLRKSNYIYLCCFENEFTGDKSILLNDLSNVTFSKNLNKTNNFDLNKSLKINIEKVLNFAVEENIRNKFYLKKIYSNALYNEIYNRFSLYFSNLNFVDSNTFEINIPENTSSEIIIKHLNYNFSDFLVTNDNLFKF